MRTSHQIIRDYVEYIGGKFTLQSCVSDTGVNKWTAYNALRVLLQDQIIRVLWKDKNRVRCFVKVTPEWLKKVRAQQKQERLRELLKTKPVSEIAAEKGCSREAVYQEIRKMDVKPVVAKGAKSPDSKGKSFEMQVVVLYALRDGRWHYGFDLRAYETLRLLVRKGWVTMKKVINLNSYQVTDSGRAVLRCEDAKQVHIPIPKNQQLATVNNPEVCCG